MTTNDRNNPWHPGPSAPPASGNPGDYASTAGLQFNVRRPFTNEDLERRSKSVAPEDMEAEYDKVEPTELANSSWGTPSRRNYGMATNVPSQGLTPPELQGGRTQGDIPGQRLVHMESQREPREGEEEAEDLGVGSIKADPREEVTVYPGQTDAPNQPSQEGVRQPNQEEKELTSKEQTETPQQQPTATEVETQDGAQSEVGDGSQTQTLQEEEEEE